MVGVDMAALKKWEGMLGGRHQHQHHQQEDDPAMDVVRQTRQSRRDVEGKTTTKKEDRDCFYYMDCWVQDVSCMDCGEVLCLTVGWVSTNCCGGGAADENSSRRRP